MRLGAALLLAADAPARGACTPMTKKKIAQPKRRTKRSAEKPVDAEIQRAAERAGIRPFTPRDRAARNLVRSIGDKIVQASDILAEQLAQMVSDKDYERLNMFGEIHHRLWEIRWDLGLVRTRASEKAVDYVAKEMTRTPAGGDS